MAIKIRVYLSTLSKEDMINHAFQYWGCLGAQEFDFNEASVDEIIGDDAYCGGNLPEDIAQKIHHVADEENYVDLFFDDMSPEQLNKFEEDIRDLDSQAKFSTEQIEDKNWNEEWQQHFSPITVNQELEIIPDFWSHDYQSQSKNQVRIIPGMGFGTGDHETTFLCLQLATELDLLSVETCLDFGCGSGILGIAASKLGANETFFYDIDDQAIENCLKNIELNKSKGCRVFGPHQKNLISSEYQLIFANILRDVLIHEKEFILDHLAPRGYLILSGLLVEQISEIKTHYLSFDQLDYIKTVNKGDWAAMIWRKRES